VSPLPVVEKFAAKLGDCRVEVTRVDRGSGAPEH
jgi:hypothetical protein